MSRTLDPVPRFWKAVVRNDDGCWDWTSARSTSGYGRLSVNGRYIQASRFSYELHDGPIPAGLWVLHHCDNPPCCRPDHLFLGTQLDNLADMNAKGRHGVMSLKGEQNPSAKLTETQVREIRQLYPAIKSPTLSRMFGVSNVQILGIVQGRKWRHVA